MSNPNAHRTALISQLRYLVDEVEASRNLLASVPDEVLEARFGAERRSVKDLYVSMASFDLDVIVPWLGEETVPSSADPAAEPIGRILDRVRDARRALLRRVHVLPAERWNRAEPLFGERLDVYGALRLTVERNTDTLRAIAHRLHRCL